MLILKKGNFVNDLFNLLDKMCTLWHSFQNQTESTDLTENYYSLDPIFELSKNN